MNYYKIILIDDEPLIIEGLKIIIEWEKYNCKIIDTATDGLIGMKKITEQNPDIVISDIRMPNCSGIDMIKKVSQTINCEFIILSGYSDFCYAKECIALGVHQYILKPVDEEELKNAILSIIKKIEEEKEKNNVLLQLK